MSRRSRSRSPSRRDDDHRRHRSPSDADIDRERAERRQRVDSRRSDSRDHHDSGRHDGKRDDRRSARDLSPPRTVSKTKSQQDDAEERQYKYPSPPRDKNASNSKPDAPKIKPVLAVSGKLYEAAMTNANGVVCKYAEPQDAAQPDRKWRIYVFKQGIEGIQDTLHISKQSKFSIGRDPKHAVIQFRRREVMDDPLAPPTIVIKPYIMDLQSTNGTFLNGKRLEGARFYELLPQDVVKFGESTREYVFIRAD